MANKRVTDLVALTTPVSSDVLPIVDVTDPTQDPTGSLKQITFANFIAPILTAALAAATSAITSAITTERSATATLSNKTLTSPVINALTLNVGSDATGDLHYRTSGGSLARLGVGSVGQFLGTNGTIPTWGIPASPTGTVSMFAGSAAPAGWLLCDGSAVSRTTYSGLYALVGTTYGSGNGSTTFNVPNLKGSVPVGYDASQTEFNALGKTGGEKTHTLITSEMPSHTHDVTNATNYTGGTGSGTAITNAASNTLTITVSNNVPAIAKATGGDVAHNNLQPYLALNFIIAI